MPFKRGRDAPPVAPKDTVDDPESMIAATDKTDEPHSNRVGATENDTEATADSAGSQVAQGYRDPRHGSWMRALAFGILPGLTLLMTLSCAYLKWEDSSARGADIARAESVEAARDGTAALLSYRPETVDKDLTAVGDRLTGNFRDSYRSLINDVVIPGAKERNISAVATVPAAASVSASSTHAIVLVLVNQTTTIGAAPPTSTASSVRVTLDKISERWLISDFTPV